MWILCSSLVVGTAACHGDDEERADSAEVGAGSSAARRLIEQIRPPVDLTTPPADATKTASGLIFKKLATANAGVQARRGDTALVHYTGWRQGTGETFFTTKGRGQPIALDLAHVAPGFGEALPMLSKGEKAILWVPPSPSAPETLVYEIEVVDIVSPPAVAKRAAAGERGAKDQSGKKEESAAKEAGRPAEHTR